jgi:hypothetical protein
LGNDQKNSNRWQDNVSPNQKSNFWSYLFWFMNTKASCIIFPWMERNKMCIICNDFVSVKTWSSSFELWYNIEMLVDFFLN